MSFVFPSTSAIDALVRVNQMDASLADAATDWMRLWILAFLYGGLAIGAATLFGREHEEGAVDARPA